MKAQRGSRGTAYTFVNLGARWGPVVKTKRRPLYPQEKDTVPIVQEAGWAPGPARKGSENPPPPGFDPRNVHFVASRCTDYAIPSSHTICYQNPAYNALVS
jgi:hypothetical protein